MLVHEYDSILSSAAPSTTTASWAELRVEALNHALEGIPEERVRYHVCYGSWHGPHVYDPPLRDVIDLVLRVRARYYLIEQANPRHEHEWRLWEDVELPDGKVLVPGVVTHHTQVVEHPELVADRLVRLANLVGRENVMGGTDCGFAQGVFLQRVHPSIQWAKLEALAEGARLATKQLFGVGARRNPLADRGTRHASKIRTAASYDAADRHGGGPGPGTAGLLVGGVVGRVPPAADPERVEGALLRAHVGRTISGRSASSGSPRRRTR